MNLNAQAFEAIASSSGAYKCKRSNRKPTTLEYKSENKIWQFCLRVSTVTASAFKGYKMLQLQGPQSVNNVDSPHYLGSVLNFAMRKYAFGKYTFRIHFWIRKIHFQNIHTNTHSQG